MNSFATPLRTRAAGRLMAFAVALLLTPGLAASAAFADAQNAQDKDQQKCIGTMNKSGGGVGKTQGKEAGGCLKNAIGGKVDSLGTDVQVKTAQACLTNDVKGKLLKADGKVTKGDNDRCQAAPAQLPDFAYTSDATVSAASKAEVLGLMEDLFGADLDAVTLGFTYTDDEAKKCQTGAQKATQKFYDTLWKTASKEAGNALKGGAVNAAAMQGTVFDVMGLDEKGKILKSQNKVASDTAKVCDATATTLGLIFPGACAAETIGTDLGDCAAERARCRFCRAFVQSNDLGNGCDVFDDGTLNASCDGGGAEARQISDPGDLITGPVGDSRVGDYLLANDVARFIIQDANQRDMHAIGTFGGNLIDAELIANPGNDNFLEIQPSVNLETVINATSIEVVNDGSNGGPAIVRSCGPDDILDFVNGSTVVEDAGFPFPSSANDKDAPVTGCTTFTLEPGSTAIEMTTEITNLATGKRQLFVGDYLAGSGEVDQWVSGPAGIGEQLLGDLGVMSFIGYGAATGRDYGYITLPDPDTEEGSSFFSTNGVAFVLHSQDVALALLGAFPKFEVSSLGTKSFTRYFGVGDGSGGNAIDLESRVKAVASGEISGCLTVGGAPNQGARVSIGEQNLGAFTNVVSTWTTDASGCYSGTVPEGSYGVAAWQKGTPYEGGGATPTIYPVVIADGAPVVRNFALPATGTLSVTVTDENSNPVPARVMVVGFDPSPDLTIFKSGAFTGVFRSIEDVNPFGLVRAEYTDSSGTLTMNVEPGNYQLMVSRGTEYSLASQAITMTAGDTTNASAQIGHVLDTTGFVSSEFHVHGIKSVDSKVSHEDRVRQFAGEGVDNIVMTDHHYHTDLGPTITALGFDAFLNSMIGEEVTTWDTGHYNAYPLTVDPTRVTGGSSDWGVEEPAGTDFWSQGSYVASPDEVEDIVLNGSTALPSTVMQINHIDDHFHPMKIDTSAVPPVSNLNAAELERFRLDPLRGATLFHHFPALEVWNGYNRSHQAEFLGDLAGEFGPLSEGDPYGRIGIWFNLLNQGLITTAIGDTDTHKFANLRSAGARTWTPSTSDAPASVDQDEVADGVSTGRAMAGQGVFVTTRLIAVENSSLEANLELSGDPLLTITDPAQGVDLEINIQAPIWAPYDRIEVYANASTTAVPTTPQLFTATPTQTFDLGGGFTRATVNVHPGVPGASRYETTKVVNFPNLTDDTWFVVVVKGRDNVSNPMFPVFPADLQTAGNTTLANLLDGNLNQKGTMAMAFTNALYVSQDGDSSFDGPLAP